MVRYAVLFLSAALSFAALAADISLTATISVPQPVFRVQETAKLNVSFTVTNAGATTVDPEINSTQLFVNGEIPDRWDMTIGNGLRSPEFWALAPGHTLYFGYQLGPAYFAKPGFYKVRWKGPHFETPEITFRVVPD
jgi:hypothetical protein